jgi:hypothetical protein
MDAGNVVQQRRRIPSAYSCFAARHRDDVKELHPGASFTDVAKILAVTWNNTREEDRAEYGAMAAAWRRNN